MDQRDLVAGAFDQLAKCLGPENIVSTAAKLVAAKIRHHQDHDHASEKIAPKEEAEACPECGGHGCTGCAHEFEPMAQPEEPIEAGQVYRRLSLLEFSYVRCTELDIIHMTLLGDDRTYKYSRMAFAEQFTRLPGCIYERKEPPNAE